MLSQNAWLVNVCMGMTSALVAGGVSMDAGRGTLARIAIELAPQVVWNVSGMVIMRPALCVNLVNMVQAVQNTAARTAKLTRRNVTGLATAFMAAILAGEEKDVMSKIVILKIV